MKAIGHEFPELLVFLVVLTYAVVMVAGLVGCFASAQ